MPICLFCLKEFEKLTREHVFPAALGGTLELPNSTCPGCNNGCSGQCEQAIARRLDQFRRIFGIPNRDGKLPTVDTTVDLDGTPTKARLYPDGKVLLTPKKTVIDDGDGKVREVVYEHLTEDARIALREKAKREGWEYTEDTLPARESEASLSGDLDFLDSPGALRLAAKIAYVAMAHRTGMPLARIAAFQRVRDFILTGTGVPPVRLFLNERFLEYAGQGPHQHSVIAAGRHGVHRVDAAVRLFGGLCYFVNLSDAYEGADFSFTLAFDAMRGKVVMALVTSLDTEFAQISDILAATDTVWDDQVAAGRSFLGTVSRAIDAIQRRNAK